MPNFIFLDSVFIIRYITHDSRKAVIPLNQD